MAKRAGAHVTEVSAGHLSMIADPQTVAQVIEQAAKATQLTRRPRHGEGRAPWLPLSAPSVPFRPLGNPTDAILRGRARQWCCLLLGKG